MNEVNPKLQQLQESIISGNIPQLVLSCISYALDLRSSDIHIEPEESHVRIRYRIDGVLNPVVEYPQNIHPAVVSRIKIMSNLKIDEQRIPQDGRTDVTTKDGKQMDLRVSTLPTVNGEKIVMRIQDKSREIPDLSTLGLQGDALKLLEAGLSSPNGIILNTGPTGSGKTTTLYSCLQRLNKTDVNILTIEDPVEIQMDGLNQSQVHHDIDYNFATGMRAALRQDPDIIMVGEIRDAETINIAIEASLTGHLVFSTIHTNSAVETITRILNMGIPNFLVSATIELIIAQRLVRKICDACKEESQPEPAMMELVDRALKNLHADSGVDKAVLDARKFYHGKGCDKCGGIGYYGRVGLYEVMHMNNELRAMILDGASSIEIEQKAIETGMMTLEQSGITKALMGETSLEEVYRVARKMDSGSFNKKSSTTQQPKKGDVKLENKAPKTESMNSQTANQKSSNVSVKPAAQTSTNSAQVTQNIAPKSANSAPQGFQVKQQVVNAVQPAVKMANPATQQVSPVSPQNVAQRNVVPQAKQASHSPQTQSEQQVNPIPQTNQAMQQNQAPQVNPTQNPTDTNV